jgi:hypothetical protein
MDTFNDRWHFRERSRYGESPYLRHEGELGEMNDKMVVTSIEWDVLGSFECHRIEFHYVQFFSYLGAEFVMWYGDICLEA